MRIRRENTLENEDIELIASVSDALAHPLRVKIFRYIMQQNRERKLVYNKDLVAHFGYAQATISQHVKKLVDSNLVEAKRDDRYFYLYANMGLFLKYLEVTKKFPIE